MSSPVKMGYTTTDLICKYFEKHLISNIQKGKISLLYFVDIDTQDCLIYTYH